MEKGWSTPAKRALLERTALQYQGASRSHKQRILARFMTVTGYVRKYAMWVLNHTEEVLQTADAPPQRYVCCLSPLTRDSFLDIVNVLSVSDTARSTLIAFSCSRCQVPTQLPKVVNSTQCVAYELLRR